MPFAPMTREEDANDCYFDIEPVKHAAEFMTVTVNCKELMRQKGAACVHVDGTARPQIIIEKYSPFIHSVLTTYKKLTGNPSIVN
jgi:carbamoyltransferase